MCLGESRWDMLCQCDLIGGEGKKKDKIVASLNFVKEPCKEPCNVGSISTEVSGLICKVFGRISGTKLVCKEVLVAPNKILPALGNTGKG